jgi:hypothetical protein
MSKWGSIGTGEWDLNPHNDFWSADFKSDYANFA